MKNPTHLSLFSGIGGLDLAAEWAGFETVGQCEWADYPTKVLEKHWPDIPRWRDIRTLCQKHPVFLFGGGITVSTAGSRPLGKDLSISELERMIVVFQNFPC